jgi:hypothetical protein
MVLASQLGHEGPGVYLFLLPGEVRVQVPDVSSGETMSDSWRDKHNITLLDDL